jgi:hypothetical protein
LWTLVKRIVGDTGWWYAFLVKDERMADEIETTVAPACSHPVTAFATEDDYLEHLANIEGLVTNGMLELEWARLDRESRGKG